MDSRVRRFCLLAPAVIAGVLFVMPSAASAQTSETAIIDNGTVQLGVWNLGHLNVPGGVPSSGTGTTTVGLRYLPTGAESTAPGCECEGWGAADASSQVTGYANESSGTANLFPVSFTSSASSATSVVDVGTTLRVTHVYEPSPATPNLYQVRVTIENISEASVDARYRRVMDWDIEPTPFAEHVTIDTGNASALLFASNDGFASANPLSGPSDGGQTGSFTDVGPDDHGALFDFGFGMVAPGQSTTFTIYYGAAGTEADAADALSAVGVEAFSFGQPSAPDGDPSVGTPNTFMFGFGQVGGQPLVHTSITSGPSGTINDSTPTFSFTSNDEEATFQCSVDDGAFTDCSSPHTTEPLADGEHTFQVRATDTAGNTDGTPATSSFTVDTTPPNTTLTSGPSGTINDSTPTFSFTSNDEEATFQCSVDDGAFTDCSSPHTTASLADGEHTFRVRATDPADNTDPTPASRSFTVDTTPPETTISSGPSGTINDSTPTFSFTSSESSSTFECSIDGATFTACTSPHTTGSLPAGAHTFRVRATDPAGNSDPTPASRSFTVAEPEPNPPAATLSLTPATATRTVGESHTVMAHAENGHGTVRFFVNGAHFISGSTGTNAVGDALFSYPSSIAGSDQIFAYLDRNGNGVQNSNEPGANATVSWSAAQQQPRENPLPGNIPVGDSIDDLPNPQPYRSANVEPVGSGEVFVQLPNGQGDAAASQSGAPKGFIPLRQAAQLPMGSILETSKGKVLVESTATNSSRTAQRAEFFSGRFQMMQRALGRNRRRPVTEMVIKGGGFRTRCASRRASASSSDIQAQDARRRRGRVVRRLWGRGTGRFRTRGRYSSATVRGTTWVVQDHCGGTFTRLPRRPRDSRVQVEDLVQRRVVNLRAGRGYFAQPRSALRRR